MSEADGRVGREQVDLALLSSADVPALVELEMRNREQLLVGAPRRDEEWFTEAGQRTAFAHALAAKEAGLGLPLGIRLLAEGESWLVGRLPLSGITRGAFQSASLGYWVDAAETGRGIATHALHLAVALAFGGLGLHRLQAEVRVGNDASAAVLQRCGFTEVGLAPQMLRLGGDWTDCRLFQLVFPAWKEPSPAGAGHRSGLTLHVELPEREEIVDLALADASGCGRRRAGHRR